MTANDRDWRGRAPEISVITPNLAIGEYPRVADVPGLRSAHGITAVLSLQDDFDHADKGIAVAALERAYADAAIEYRRRPMADLDPEAVARFLPETLTELAGLVDARHRVLVHCNAGYNRAPTIVVAYLHRMAGMSLTAARDTVRSRRACMPYMALLERLYETTGR